MNQFLAVVFMAATSFLSGCATANNYEQILRSWVGKNIDDLVNSWGYPTRTFEAPNGNKVYAYDRAATGVTPVYRTPTQTTYALGTAVTTGGHAHGGQPVTHYCSTFFETNSDREIIRWRWEGNSCRR